jgi:hypothetical protein
VLKFKGALGFFSQSSKDREKNGDSGNSSDSDSSDDAQSETKQYYTSTGLLIPHRQAISEITTSRQTMKEINEYIDGYKKKRKHLNQFHRLFDPKQLVN